MRFTRVTVIGAGLIGGSFSLALKRAGMVEHVTGVDIASNLEKALKARAIDSGFDVNSELDLQSEDLIYLAAPVRAIINFLEAKRGSLHPGTIVTDAGSTKREICRAAEALPSDIAFVGGHPLAGSQRCGVEWARADLFEGATYALVLKDQPTETDRNALEVMTELVKQVGGTPVRTTSADHDNAVAQFSHVPQLLSTALAAVASGYEGESRLSGTGFSDMTRLASSSWSVWEDICLTNRDEIAASLGNLNTRIESFIEDLKRGDLTRLRESWLKANSSVDRLERNQE